MVLEKRLEGKRKAREAQRARRPPWAAHPAQTGTVRALSFPKVLRSPERGESLADRRRGRSSGPACPAGGLPAGAVIANQLQPNRLYYPRVTSRSPAGVNPKTQQLCIGHQEATSGVSKAQETEECAECSMPSSCAGTGPARHPRPS